jgi:hypothetical protein
MTRPVLLNPLRPPMKSKDGTTSVPRMMTTGVSAILALGLVLALTGPEGPTQPDDALAPTSERLISTNVVDVTAPSGLADVPESCPVTVPGDDAFTPASKAPDDPPSVYEVVWYGTPELWTMIDRQREINSKRWLQGDKSFWWSENYTSGEPAEVAVTAVHLNGSAPTVKDGAAAGSGFNPFMLATTHRSVTMVSVELPDPGCWELTAEFEGASLSYVIWVSDV